mgnify:CR=1 FL=1
MSLNKYIYDLKLNYKQIIYNKDIEIERLKIEILNLTPKLTQTIHHTNSTTKEEIIEQLKSIMA